VLLTFGVQTPNCRLLGTGTEGIQVEPAICCVFFMSRSLAPSLCIQLQPGREYLSGGHVRWSDHLLIPRYNTWSQLFSSPAWIDIFVASPVTSNCLPRNYNQLEFVYIIVCLHFSRLIAMAPNVILVIFVGDMWLVKSVKLLKHLVNGHMWNLNSYTCVVFWLWTYFQMITMTNTWDQSCVINYQIITTSF